MNTQQPHESIGRGLVAMIAAVALFSFMDMTAKWLAMAGYHPMQVVFLRFLIALVPATVVVLVAGTEKLHTERLHLHVARGVLMAITLTLFFTGLRDLPLAEGISVAFTAPLFVTALSGPLLGERVGLARWLAVGVGFIGVLIVVRPGGATFQPQSLYILASALCFAFAMLLTRRLTRTESNTAIYAYTTFFAALTAGCFQPFIWQTPEAAHIPWFLTIGIVGGLSSFLIIIAYRNAPASVVAPFDYMALLWGALWGWIFWREVPDGAVWTGAAVIATAGIYITWRETKGKKQPAMQKSPAG
ncbi:MAG: DMT family transporter [Hyphomicrobiales bacterium]